MQYSNFIVLLVNQFNWSTNQHDIYLLLSITCVFFVFEKDEKERNDMSSRWEKKRRKRGEEERKKKGKDFVVVSFNLYCKFFMQIQSKVSLKIALLLIGYSSLSYL